MTEAAARIVGTLEAARDLMDASARDPALLEAADRPAEAPTATLRADAQHIAGEIFATSPGA